MLARYVWSGKEQGGNRVSRDTGQRGEMGVPPSSIVPNWQVNSQPGLKGWHSSRSKYFIVQKLQLLLYRYKVTKNRQPNTVSGSTALAQRSKRIWLSDMGPSVASITRVLAFTIGLTRVLELGIQL